MMDHKPPTPKELVSGIFGMIRKRVELRKHGFIDFETGKRFMTYPELLTFQKNRNIRRRLEADRKQYVRDQKIRKRNLKEAKLEIRAQREYYRQHPKSFEA